MANIMDWPSPDNPSSLSVANHKLVPHVTMCHTPGSLESLTSEIWLLYSGTQVAMAAIMRDATFGPINTCCPSRLSTHHLSQKNPEEK
jgi:hypothetical protein